MANNIDLSSGLNAGKAVTEIDQLLAKLKEMTTTVDTLNKSFTNNTKAEEAGTTATKKKKEALSALEKLEKTNLATLEKLNTGTSKQALALERSKQALASQNKARKEQVASEREAANAISQANNALKKEVTTVREAEKQNAKLRLAVKNSNTATEEGRAAILKYNEVINKNDDYINKNSDTRKKGAQTVGQYTDSIIKAVNQLKKEEQELKNAASIQKKALSSGNLSIKQQNQLQLEYKETTSALDKVNAELVQYEDVSDSTITSNGDMTSSLSMVGGKFGMVISGFKSAAMAAKAFIATPIGLVLAAVAGAVALISKAFKSSQPLMDAFSRASKSISAAMAVVTDRIASFFEKMQGGQTTLKDIGKSLVDNILNRFKAIIEIGGTLGDVIGKVLTGKFNEAKEAAKGLKEESIQLATGMNPDQQRKFADGFNGIASEIKNETKAASDLEAQRQKLRDEEIASIQTLAKLDQALQKNRLEAKDQTKSDEERLASLKAASLAEIEATNIRVRLATERARIMQAEVALGNSTAEEIKEAEEASAAAIEARTRSYQTQQRILSELSGFEKTIETERANSAKAASQQKASQLQKDYEAEQAYHNAINKLEEEFYKEADADDANDELEAKKEALAAETNAILEAYQERLENFRGSEEERKEIDEEYANEMAELNLERISKELEDFNGTEEEKTALLNAWIIARDAIKDGSAAKDKQRADEELAVAQKIHDYKMQMVNELFNFGQTLGDRKIANLEKETDAEGNITEAAAAKIAKIKKRQAIADKAQSLFNIGLKTAEGVMNYGAKVVTAPLIPWVIALGAVQAASVIASPIPQFFKGTDSAPAGLAIVGEKGAEAIEHNGNVMFTPSTATLMDLGSGGQRIINAEKTKAKYGNVDNSGVESRIDKLIAKPVSSINVTRDGIVRMTRVGNAKHTKIQRATR